MNYARDVVAAQDPRGPALIELSREGARREWSFGEVDAASGALAGHLVAHGVGRGDVVMTLIGNRPEWVLAMVACFRIGAVALPCNEQLRAKDLRLRLDVAAPKLVLVDARNRAQLDAALRLPTASARPATPTPATPTPAAPAAVVVLAVPDETLLVGDAPPFAELDPEDPCLLTFTSGTEGDPKAVVHVQRYLDGQRLQAEHWLAAGPGDVVWCTAASGWSKSARNVFVAPWLRGACALLHDQRFDPEERLRILAEERVNLLCMAPTEYRVIAKRLFVNDRPPGAAADTSQDLHPSPQSDNQSDSRASDGALLGHRPPRTTTDSQTDAKRTEIGHYPRLRGLVAAGEALNPEVLDVWRAATGIEIRDGFGQTETGQLTGAPRGEAARPGSMGRPLPGVRLWIDDGELVVDPSSVPTFFRGYLGHEPAPRDQPWRTGDRVREEDGWLYFEGRTDDVISSAGYRIGPFEVESALVAHPAVAEAAVVAAPDEERGQIVRAVIVLRDGIVADDELIVALQEHVKTTTAPYKYPRRIDVVDELPKTTSGKIQRALLRREG